MIYTYLIGEIIKNMKFVEVFLKKYIPDIQLSSFVWYIVVNEKSGDTNALCSGKINS